MQLSTVQLVRRLCSLSQELEQVYWEKLEHWAPDDPPSIVLFGDFADTIVDKFEAYSPEAINSNFQLIEAGMDDRDEDLSTIVATGFIEALVSHAERLGKWKKVKPLLGKESALYEAGWTKWCLKGSK